MDTCAAVSSVSGEYGVCLFKDGSVCEEWDFFRNKCKVGECKKDCKFEGSEKRAIKKHEMFEQLMATILELKPNE